MRRKFTFARSDADPCTTEDNILFKQTGYIHQNTSQSTQRQGQENCKQEGVTGSLTSPTTEMNSESWKLMSSYLKVKETEQWPV